MTAILETPASWMIIAFFIGLAIIVLGSVRALRHRGSKADSPWLRNKSTPTKS